MHIVSVDICCVSVHTLYHCLHPFCLEIGNYAFQDRAVRPRHIISLLHYSLLGKQIWQIDIKPCGRRI